MSTTALPYWLDFGRRLRLAGYRGRLLVGGTHAARFPHDVLAGNVDIDGVVVGDRKIVI